MVDNISDNYWSNGGKLWIELITNVVKMVKCNEIGIKCQAKWWTKWRTKADKNSLNPRCFP